MKKNILFMFILIGIFLISLTSTYECQDQTSFWNVPCDLVTPVLDCSLNATITNINNTLINSSVLMTPVGDGTYNVTFNYSTIATYSVVLCDNISGTVDVVYGIEEDEPQFNLWLVLFIIFFLLLIFGGLTSNYILLFAAGCLIMVMGLWIFSSGSFSLYSATTYWFVYPLAWIFVGLGIMLSVVSGIKYMELMEEE